LLLLSVGLYKINSLHAVFFLYNTIYCLLNWTPRMSYVIQMMTLTSL